MDEKPVERKVYTDSFKHIGALFNKGENGADIEPSLYRTTDFTKPHLFNTYVLGLKISKPFPLELEDFEHEIGQLLVAYSNIMSDISQGQITSAKRKIYAAYFAQGAIKKCLTLEFKEVSKLISNIVKK